MRVPYANISACLTPTSAHAIIVICGVLTPPSILKLNLGPLKSKTMPICSKSRLLNETKKVSPKRSSLLESLESIKEKPADPRQNAPAKVKLDSGRISKLANTLTEAGVNLGKK